MRTKGEGSNNLNNLGMSLMEGPQNVFAETYVQCPLERRQFLFLLLKRRGDRVGGFVFSLLLLRRFEFAAAFRVHGHRQLPRPHVDRRGCGLVEGGDRQGQRQQVPATLQCQSTVVEARVRPLRPRFMMALD